MFWRSKDTFSVARDAIAENGVLQTFDSQMDIVSLAFEKCIEPQSIRGSSMRPFGGDRPEAKTDGRHELTSDERECLEGYTMLFTKYTQRAFDQFAKGYERMAREAMAKMRQAEAMQRAKGDMK